MSNDSYYKILPREIIISTNQTGYYGETPKLTNEHEVISGSILPGDLSRFNAYLSLKTEATKNSPVLEEGQGYTITATSTNAHITKNYSIKTESLYVVMPKNITVVLLKQSSFYGDPITLNNDAYNITSGSIVSGDDLHMELSTNATDTAKCNTYNLTHTYNNQNYNVTFVESSYEILPRPIVITLYNQYSTYGESINLQQNQYKIKSGNVLAGDTLSIRLSTNATNGSNAGNYTITGHYVNNNYSVTFEGGNYTINKRKITIRLLDQEVTRGITFGLDPTMYELVEGEIINPSTFSITPSTDAHMFSIMGNYDLTATCNDPNYDVTFINAKVRLKVSILDFVFIAAGVGLITGVAILIIKIKKKKNKNKELFDKWIKW